MEIAQKVHHARWRYLLDRERLLSSLLLSPAIGYIVLLIGVPLLFAIYLSFTNAISGHLEADFVGLKNFRAIVTDPIFLQALKNTFIFTFVSQVIVLILAKVLALALVKSFPGRPILRFLLLLPWVAPISLTTLAWDWVLGASNSSLSVINWTLRAVGVLGPNDWIYWTAFPEAAMAAIILIHVWRMLPFATIIILAGLTSIPQEIQDAATIDGAGPWRRLFEVTLPLMLPIVAVAVLFGIIFTATDMTVVYILTRGGPYNSTHVLASLAWQRGIFGGQLGEGAAIAVFLLPLLLVVAFLMLRLARRTEVT
ncbi:Trehalose transport system permease protein SugA [bacterium HR16]|nr:Trehalose transport system permease protein SugA [bacterium HR16]